MSNYDFTTTLYGSADGTNMYALTNPSSGAPPAYDTTINVNVSVVSAQGFLEGTASEITSVHFDNATNFLDSVGSNADLGLLYDLSDVQYSLYSVVNAIGRGSDSNIPVVSESAVSTDIINISGLSTVLNTVANASSLLAIIHSQVLDKWVDNSGTFTAQFVDGDTLTLYANYSGPVSNAYSLNGVTGGTVTFTGSGGSNVTASLDSLTADSTNTFSVTYRVIITACAALD